ncbi:TetR family transcriptional regulator C-terminal domain-containing protein [Streptomyces sp. I05A-00742]|uniref:LmrA/YxaF family transcription factor n=1 Tax=Streptomyces sp. I05A-00742 TaxID=2732853 RepID=UPI001BB296D2|nr:TetR/AcrR family transcriptional regulator [Streptomyces sp. I05A-00742]
MPQRGRRRERRPPPGRGGRQRRPGPGLSHRRAARSAVAAIRHDDQEFAGILRGALDSEEDPGDALAARTRNLAGILRASEWAGGCPVTATALGTAGRAPDIQQAAAEAFARRRELVHAGLTAAGIAEDDARELAHPVVSPLEGAEPAARVSRGEEPLHTAGRRLARLISCYR